MGTVFKTCFKFSCLCYESNRGSAVFRSDLHNKIISTDLSGSKFQLPLGKFEGHAWTFKVSKTVFSGLTLKLSEGHTRLTLLIFCSSRSDIHLIASTWTALFFFPYHSKINWQRVYMCCRDLKSKCAIRLRAAKDTREIFSLSALFLCCLCEISVLLWQWQTHPLIYLCWSFLQIWVKVPFIAPVSSLFAFISSR